MYVNDREIFYQIQKEDVVMKNEIGKAEEKQILAYNNKWMKPSELAKKISRDKEAKKLQTLNFRMYAQYPKRYEEVFVLDLSFINTTIVHISTLTKYFKKNEWPELYKIVEEIKIIADIAKERQRTIQFFIKKGLLN